MVLSSSFTLVLDVLLDPENRATKAVRGSLVFTLPVGLTDMAREPDPIVEHRLDGRPQFVGPVRGRRQIGRRVDARQTIKNIEERWEF